MNDPTFFFSFQESGDTHTPSSSGKKIKKSKNKNVATGVPTYVESTPKKQFLNVRRLSDDELSEADSMTRFDKFFLRFSLIYLVDVFLVLDFGYLEQLTFMIKISNMLLFSMDQLDDDQIEQLMLESDGFDILEDSNSAPKS